LTLFSGWMIAFNVVVAFGLTRTLKRKPAYGLIICLIGVLLGAHLIISGYLLQDGWVEGLQTAQENLSSTADQGSSGQLPIPGRDAAITGTAYALPAIVMLAGLAFMIGWTFGVFRHLRGY